MTRSFHRDKGNVAVPSRRDCRSCWVSRVRSPATWAEGTVLSPSALILGQPHRDGGGRGHTEPPIARMPRAPPSRGVGRNAAGKDAACLARPHVHARPLSVRDPLKPGETATAQPGPGAACVSENDPPGARGAWTHKLWGHRHHRPLDKVEIRCLMYYELTYLNV